MLFPLDVPVADRFYSITVRSTNVGGSVLHTVAERSQARWLQQLVDAIRQAIFEGQVALHQPG